MIQPGSVDTLAMPGGSPFDLEDEAAYRAWRHRKMERFPDSVQDLTVDVENGRELSRREFEGIVDCCRRANMAVYRLHAGDFADKALVRAIGVRFGLWRLDKNLRADEDAITTLQVPDGGDSRGYIPYTNRALSWHTDGYYNAPDQQVRGVLMHCVSQAAAGGANLLLDHELVYLQMRDENPEFIAALAQPDVMTIPPNVEDGVELRGAQTGPVFSVDPQSGSLHMRYTARGRNILWKQDATTSAAVECLRALMRDDSPRVFRVLLNPGEGIICNNVLHGRDPFRDHPETGRRRLLYRARYYDRIAGTGFR